VLTAALVQWEGGGGGGVKWVDTMRALCSAVLCWRTVIKNHREPPTVADVT